MCDVKPEVIDWLFCQRIVTKGVTVFSGNGGVAKTTMALDTAARGSKGRDFCDGSKNEVGVFGTILLSDEDDASSILVPRLMAADADLSMIHRVTAVQTTKDGEPTGPRQFNLESDLDIIRQRLTEHPEIRLVVIDPVSNYLGHLELNSDQDYRAALMPAIRMAQEMNVAIVVIAHTTAAGGQQRTKFGGVTGVRTQRIGVDIPEERTGKRATHAAREIQFGQVRWHPLRHRRLSGSHRRQDHRTGQDQVPRLQQRGRGQPSRSG